MRAIVWITENTWPACIDGARALIPQSTEAEITLLHVAPSDVEELVERGREGLLGRRRPRPPEPALRAIADEEAISLLSAAQARLSRPASLDARRAARVEREVVAAAAGADLLLLARDGEPKLGPKSLGKQARFVVDHAPCPVLLVWAFAPPGLETIPPAPR